jgi:hypothetical protein
MTKKTIVLITLAMLLAGLSIYLNKDRFRAESIQIGERWVTPRPGMLRRGQNPNTPVLLFLLNRPVQLNEIKVIPLADLATNKYAHPIWHLTTDSNSVPVKELVYGMPIRGMRPAVKGATADPLQPGVHYRLLLQAGSEKAQFDFQGAKQP